VTAKRFTYKSSDAWVLLAIVYAGRDGGADLSAIVGAGDYINHAIFTFGELQNALFKLTSDGFVREDGGRFFPTAAALDFRSPRRAAKKTHAVQVDRDEMAALLGAEPWSPGPDQFRQEFTYPGVTLDDFDAGVRAYSNRVDAFMAKGRRSRPRKKMR
jgi:hypothetical protein